jgi:hypothetical protein
VNDVGSGWILPHQHTRLIVDLSACDYFQCTVPAWQVAIDRLHFTHRPPEGQQFELFIFKPVSPTGTPQQLKKVLSLRKGLHRSFWVSCTIKKDLSGAQRKMCNTYHERSNILLAQLNDRYCETRIIWNHSNIFTIVLIFIIMMIIKIILIMIAVAYRPRLIVGPQKPSAPLGSLLGWLQSPLHCSHASGIIAS